MTEQPQKATTADTVKDIQKALADGARMILEREYVSIYIPNADALAAWNTRPSASREEIAMAIGFASRHKFDASKDAAEFWEYLSSDGKRWYLRMADAVLGIQPTTTPGNTDPMLIAKYDDELRKVQGGWRDMDSAPKWTKVILCHEDWNHTAVAFLHGVTLKWTFEDGIAIALPERLRYWMPLPPPPTGHPTEQPVYETCSKCSGSGQIIGDAGEPMLCSECKGDTVTASEQPSVKDVLSKAANDAIQGYAERTDRYASGFRNGIFTMCKSILRSLAQEGE